MKTVLFISSNKMLGQGLSAAIQSKPELDFLWAAQLNYPQAIVGVDIFHADVVVLDIGATFRPLLSVKKRVAQLKHVNCIALVCQTPKVTARLSV